MKCLAETKAEPTNTEKELNLTNAVLPQGITMYEIEEVVLKKIERNS